MSDLISRQAVLDELEKLDWQELYLPIHFKQILDNVPSVESKVMKKSCSTCKNNDDEFSGECYECLKGIFDHYEAESEDKE